MFDALFFGECCVKSAFRAKLGMRATLHDAPLVNHDDAIAMGCR